MPTSKLIAVDFDGTCVRNEYPAIGASIQAERWLRHLEKTYHIRYILLTMRSDDLLREAEEWFAQHQISLWASNDNPDQARWAGNTRKVYANLYVDDTGLGVPLCFDAPKPYVDWDTAGPMLEDWCATYAGTRTNECLRHPKPRSAR